MYKPEEMVLKLNEFLEAEQFPPGQFKSLIKLFIERYKPEIKILDFDYYRESSLHMAQKKKMKYVSIQDFETAAKFRELEKECLNYIEIKTEYNIKKSMFYYDQNYLFYFHLGTAKNDKKVKEYIKKLV